MAHTHCICHSFQDGKGKVTLFKISFIAKQLESLSKFHQPYIPKFNTRFDKISQASHLFKVGDVVAYLGSGTYAEKTLVPATHVLKLNEYGVSMLQGAAILLQGLTAAYLTFDAHTVSPGTRVLIPVIAVIMNLYL